MFTLVTGGSGSGKSEYAEQLIVRSFTNKDHRYYIATMKPFGKEGQERIKKHRRQRAGRGFHTIEIYQNLYEYVTKDKIFSETSDVLLECMSNLVANEFFDGDIDRECVVDSIEKGIVSLLSKVDNLVVVTNEVFSDGVAYDEETMQYISCLAKVNERLAKLADCVVEVVYTIPVIKKEAANLQHVSEEE